MVYTVNRVSGKKNILIYNNDLLLLSKDDDVIFKLDLENFKYEIKFSFSDEGESYSTTFWRNTESKTLHYMLHKWDSSTYVEISKPILIEESEAGKFWMKFRNQSLENKEHRRFNLSIWQES